MPNIKAIFLDIDGVLNYNYSKSYCGMYIGIDNRRVRRLARIVKATDAKIILSSDWKDRYIHGAKANEQPYHHAKYMMNKLRKQGLRIYDTIDKNFEWGERGDAVLDYVKKHNITNYVILDDRMFPGFHEPPLSDHFIKTFADYTDATSGLTDDLVDIAIDIINNDKTGTYIEPEIAKFFGIINPINEEDRMFYLKRR